MKLIDALQKAKEDGFKKAIHHPYTYRARSIDSHIAETEKTMNDSDYKGSVASNVIWKYNAKEQSIDSDNDQWFDLIK